MNESGRVSFAEVVMLVLATGVLAALFLPVFARGRNGDYWRSRCANNLHQLTLAFVQYANDWSGDLPAVPGVVKSTADAPGEAPEDSGEESLGLLFDVYNPEIKVFWCPSEPPRDDPDLARPAAGGRNPSFREHDLTSYAYDPRHREDHKPGVALVADRGGGAGVNSPNLGGYGQNVLYLDGSVKWRTETDCGYDGDEIYVRNDELADKRCDSWLTNSRPELTEPTPEELAAASEGWRRREKIRSEERAMKYKVLAVAAAVVLLPTALVVAVAFRRRRAVRGRRQGRKT